MLAAGETVTVALSGGADSVALLLLLHDLSSIEVLHVNHGLRGAAADADEAFCRALANRLGLPFEAVHVDVASLAAELGIGEEEAGRIARRRIFAKKRIVALAHHMNDQAETFLFRAARGSSLAGLACMRPVEMLTENSFCSGSRATDSQGEQTVADVAGQHADAGGANATRIIRPLLGIPRHEIEEWLIVRGQDWREDATNQDEIYTRNAIRHSVVPVLEEKVNTETVRHLAEAAENMAAADAFMRAEAMRHAKELIRAVPSLDDTYDNGEPREQIAVFDEICGLPEILQGYMILDALQRAAGTRRDFGRLHVDQVRALFSMPAGKRVELPHGVIAVREKGATMLQRGR